MTWKDIKHQYYAALWVNIMSLSYGTSIGWTSSSLLVLESDDSPLDTGPITKEESSWIGALLCLGGVIGNFFFGWLSDRIGRKPSFMITAMPQIVSWLLIIFAKNTTYLYVSRILCGVASGGTYLLAPVYVTEISDDIIRGRLCSILVLAGNTGILLSFIIGNYLEYYTIAYILLTLPIIFLIGMIFLPETPQYLMRNGNEEKAEKAIQFFANDRNYSSCKISILKDLQDKSVVSDEKCDTDNSITWDDLTNRVAIKAFMISIGLMALCLFCGVFAITNYAASIFIESGSDLSPTFSAIIVGAIQLIGSYLSSLLIERTGRKILLATSALGSGIGLICLGLHGCLESFGVDMSAYGWMPVASLSFTIFIAAFGVLTLPFVVSTEIMPPKLRSIGTGVGLTFSWGAAFLLVKYLYVLINVLQFYGCMFMFGILCFIGTILVVIFVPETRGKSTEEITKMLS